MAKNRQQLRDNIIVTQRNGARLPYVLRLCKVLQEDGDGNPRQLLILKKSDVVNIEGGESFVTAYVPFEVFGDDL